MAVTNIGWMKCFGKEPGGGSEFIGRKYNGDDRWTVFLSTRETSMPLLVGPAFQTLRRLPVKTVVAFNSFRRVHCTSKNIQIKECFLRYDTNFPEFKIQCGHRNFEPCYRLKVSWNLARWTFGLIAAWGQINKENVSSFTSNPNFWAI